MLILLFILITFTLLLINQKFNLSFAVVCRMKEAKVFFPDRTLMYL